jgi:multiple sugar transport system substrate-binding protein
MSQRTATALVMFTIGVVLLPLLQSQRVSSAPPAKIALLTHPVLYAAMGKETGVIAEFRKRTGIEVEAVTGPTEQIQEKALAEFVAGSGRFDVVNLIDTMYTSEMVQFLEPLDDRVQATDAAYGRADLIGSLVDSLRLGGRLMGIPFRVGTAMLYYRADLFQQKGLQAPKGWDEFMVAAKALTLDTNHDGKIDIYGVSARGKPGFEVLTDFTNYVYAHGGLVLNQEHTRCALADPPAVAGARTFVDVYRKGYASPDMLAHARDDLIGNLQQGRAAMGVMFSPYWGFLQDAKATPFAGKFGWALVPTSPGVPPGRTLNSLWSLAIDRKSKNKDAAWELVKWLSNRETQLEMALKYNNGPVRASVYENAEYGRKFPLAMDSSGATQRRVSSDRS